MYGNKRITIDKYGTIAVSGGKSHIPIGRLYKGSQRIVGRILKPEYMYANQCNGDNSTPFDLSSVGAVREHAKQIYKHLLNQ